ncbi:MAG: hypothetical protein N2044_05805 [Cyclobacteriaceae bacterium]|nr:hypothetical protein [Cyclobacteriaceae bacterium]MCX7637346.1 hypothetical protein [Cyclobacteriaceae bacterium]MDW8330429.1 hypothetical protein [Cyclobacteriaceae bacterium]
MSIDHLFVKITSALEEREIPYMVSGNMAMLVYAVARTTRDLDIVIELNLSSLPAFFSIFNERFYLHRASVEEEVKRRGMFNVIDQDSGFKIDFVVKKETAYRESEFKRRVRLKLFNHEAWFVSPEDLILSKLIWIQQLQSDRQMEDIRTLLTLPVDRTYLNYWINHLNLSTFNLL